MYATETCQAFTFFFDLFYDSPLKKKGSLPSDCFNCVCPFSKEETDALAVVCPTNTFCDHRTNINGDKLFAQALMFVLWNTVCDLKILLMN